MKKWTEDDLKNLAAVLGMPPIRFWYEATEAERIEWRGNGDDPRGVALARAFARQNAS